MKQLIFITALQLIMFNSWSQWCDTPSPVVTDKDCSSILASSFITSGSINSSGQEKYVTSVTGNIGVGTGAILYICGDVTVSMGSGTNLLALNGGTLVITSCGSLTINGGGSPTYFNSSSEIVNYGTLNIIQSNSYFRFDNGAKLFNYGSLNMKGHTFLKNGSIINDNNGNYSIIETLLMRYGSGGSTQYASSSSKLCLAENSCLKNNTIIQGSTSNWLEYGGDSGDAYLYGTTYLSGNGGTMSDDNGIQVCTTTSGNSRWGSVVTTNPGSIDNCLACNLVPTCISALGVELNYFEATIIVSDVVLNWETSSETQNYYFEIERLEKGIWSTVGKVNGNGNSTDFIEYNFVDTRPLAGITYYRLKQFDFDGVFEYSEIRNVEVEFDGVKVFPNPTNLNFTVTFPQTEQEINIEIVDLMGRKILSNIYSKVNSINLNLKRKGLFIVKVSIGDKVFLERLVCD